jgi:hypothetical protein
MAALLAPEKDWSWIRRRPELPSAREVRASRKPLNPPDPSVLFYSALRYCRAADDETGSIPSAIRFRNGLIMAFATWSVLRRKNLAEGQLGVHLHIHDGMARIVFDRGVKNSQPIDILVPDLLLPVLKRYLSTQRPVLLRGRADCQHLWINRHGKPLHYQAFYLLFECLRDHHIESRRSRHRASAGLAHSSTGTVDKFYGRPSADGVSKARLKIVAGRRRSG